MKQYKKDITIVGGGLTGMALAAFLAETGLKIALIEKYDISSKKYLSKDLRTTAISYGTRKIFEKYGMWKDLRKFAQPIKKIIVYDREENNKINFANSESDSFLGYVLENEKIKKTFLNKINSKKNIKILKNSSVNAIEKLDEHLLVKTKNFFINTNLLVAADGKNSFVRNYFKNKLFFKNYNHSALVANIIHLYDHKGIAHEFFFNSGPLALLPVHKDNLGNFRSTLIWSNNKNYIRDLTRTDDKFFLEILNEKIERHLGSVKKVINKKSFPLSAHLNSSFYDDRVVFLGDAAHSIHPIAGQGWNLGIRDLRELSNLIEESMSLGLDIGSNFLCKKFHQKRFYDAYNFYQITDKLNSIFMFDNILTKKTRELGFGFIDSNKSISNFIANFAMGKNL